MNAPSIFDTNRHIASLVSVLWLLLAAWLLLDSSPGRILWLKPVHFFMGLALGISLSASILSYTNHKATKASSHTLVSGTVLIVLLELIQYSSNIRSVQLQDVIDGIAGIALSSVITTLAIALVGPRKCITVFTTGSFAALIITTYVYANNRYTPGKNHPQCELSQYTTSSWNSLLLGTFNEHSTTVFTANADLALCTFESGVSNTGNALEFKGGGLRSVELKGLLDAIREKGTFTFGVKFKIKSEKHTFPPSIVAQINRNGNPHAFIARITQYGSSGSATIQFNNPKRTGTAFLNRLQTQYHEVVISYDGITQRTWLDGTLIGSEVNALETPHGDEELVLNIGWRSDKLLKPFDGSVAGIFVGTEPVTINAPPNAKFD